MIAPTTPRAATVMRLRVPRMESRRFPRAEERMTGSSGPAEAGRPSGSAGPGSDSGSAGAESAGAGSEPAGRLSGSEPVGSGSTVRLAE